MWLRDPGWVEQCTYNRVSGQSAGQSISQAVHDRHQRNLAESRLLRVEHRERDGRAREEGLEACLASPCLGMKGASVICTFDFVFLGRFLIFGLSLFPLVPVVYS